MERLTLQATRREQTGKKVQQLRRAGKLPAVLYGRSLKQPVPVTLDRIEASKALRKIGYSTLILVNLDGEEHNTLVRDFQVDVIRGDLTHVDFLVVSLTEKVRAEVSIVVEGKAPVIANLGRLWGKPKCPGRAPSGPRALFLGPKAPRLLAQPRLLQQLRLPPK